MKPFLKSAVAAILGLAALSATTANAHDRPAKHSQHDSRNSHDVYYGAKPHKASGVTFSVHYNNKAHRKTDRRVVNRQVFDTRFRARIVLLEEVVHYRRGRQLVCTVEARGPEARYISERRIHRVAQRNCSSRARIRVFA